MDEEEVEQQPEGEQDQSQELPALDEGYEYSLNEDGEVELGEDGEPVVVETASITSEDQPPVTDEDEPATVYLPQGEGAASARFREALADPELAALMDAAMEEKVNRKLAAFGVAQSSLTTAAARYPEVFRKYGGKIQMALAMFPEHERHTPKSVDLAIALATIEDKAGKPEFPRELLKLAQQLNGTQSAQPKPPKAPIPAASRPPTPSSGVRSQATTPRDSMLKLIMKDAGVSKAEAEELIKGGR